MRLIKKFGGLFFAIAAIIFVNTVVLAAGSDASVSAVVVQKVYSTSFKVTCNLDYYVASEATAQKEYLNNNATLTNLSGALESYDTNFYVYLVCTDSPLCKTEKGKYTYNGSTSLSLAYEKVSDDELAAYAVHAKLYGTPRTTSTVMSGTVKP